MTTNNYIFLYRKHDRVVQGVLFKDVFNAIVKQLDGGGGRFMASKKILVDGNIFLKLFAGPLETNGLSFF